MKLEIFENSSSFTFVGGVQIDDRELKQIKTVICQDLVSATPKNKTVWEDSIICEKTSAFTDCEIREGILINWYLNYKIV